MRAVADATGVFGPQANVTWKELGVDPSDGKVPWVFARPFKDFRRLDALARFVCLAAEALGVDFPTDTALVLDTAMGCLHSDRRFEKSLHEVIKPAVFPYTLPSTCLGELAIRHSITGLSLCLTTPDCSAGLEEAGRLLDLGEAAAALVCRGDVVPPEVLKMEAVYVTR